MADSLEHLKNTMDYAAKKQQSVYQGTNDAAQRKRAADEAKAAAKAYSDAYHKSKPKPNSQASQDLMQVLGGKR